MQQTHQNQWAWNFFSFFSSSHMYSILAIYRGIDRSCGLTETQSPTDTCQHTQHYCFIQDLRDYLHLHNPEFSKPPNFYEECLCEFSCCTFVFFRMFHYEDGGKTVTVFFSFTAHTVRHDVKQYSTSSITGTLVQFPFLYSPFGSKF